jgi:hypothetical protein
MESPASANSKLVRSTENNHPREFLRAVNATTYFSQTDKEVTPFSSLDAGNRRAGRFFLTADAIEQSYTLRMILLKFQDELVLLKRFLTLVVEPECIAEQQMKPRSTRRWRGPEEPILLIRCQQKPGATDRICTS